MMKARLAPILPLISHTQFQFIYSVTHPLINKHFFFIQRLLSTRNYVGTEDAEMD